ncbi:MAG: SDR family NAD(P)-dependent oxidoreductase [Rhodovarius sp.]|nr:SDR family NAD(P)-dependent oxidoreductase [Rhodovarius sp.]
MSTGPRRAASNPAAEPIAVVGIACRLPGAPDLEAFWTLLAEGRDAVTTVPADRFTQAAWYHPRIGEPGRSYTFAAGTIGDVHSFDHAAFGISPREAAEMDPQQRLMLELAREAFEDAGWREADIAGQEIGVYIGASTTDHADLRQFDPASADRYMMTGGALSIIANRLTNVFDLRGPAQTIDTACSSALVALHHAAEALRAGRIPAALVGGVNMLLSPAPYGGFSRATMLSPRGRCHAFDARADGYVRAEGGVVVLLKRLSDARRAGDLIHGVILASAVNAAGRTVGLSLPNKAAQAALLTRLLEDSGISPARIRYFEAHGTGTAAGDPIEAAAIGEAVARRRGKAPPLLIGSAKTNIGHTEAPSGLVGLAKALLILRHRQVPPSLHFETPNPNIPFAELRLEVADRLQPLPGARDAVIGVNSFGFGGTNAAVLVGPAPAERRVKLPAGRLPPLVLSARSEAALAGLAQRWAELLRGLGQARAAALIRGQIRHRDLLAHRLVVRGATPAEMAERLEAWQRQQRGGEAPAAPPPAVAGVAARGQGVAFVFSGNGAQWPGMAQAAMASNAVFRAAVREADRHLRPLLGWSVARSLAAGVDEATLAATDHAQPLLFAIQVGLVAALAEAGVRPALVIGHSVGEVAAAWAAGLLSLPAACRLIVARSRHQHATRGQGRMAALGASAQEAEPVLAACSAPGEPPVEIAAFNAPNAITVAGPPAALARLDAAARERRWSFVPLDLDYAFHSAYMEPVRQGLLADLRGMRARQPRVPMISTVTAEPLEAAQCTPGYWWRNLREPVRFAPALARATEYQPRLFLEIGPNPVLLSYLREGLRAAGSEAGYTHTLSKRDLAGDPIPGVIDRAIAHGADPREAAIFRGPAERRGLPRAPLQRSPATVPRSQERILFADQVQDHPLLGFRRSQERREWTRLIDLALEPWLADHKLAGEPVLPAAAMLEIALAAAAARLPEAEALEVSEFAILRSLPLSAEETREMRARLDEEGQFVLESRRRLAEEAWTLHARGQLRAVARLPEAPPPLPSEAPRRIDTDYLAAAAAVAGLDYGPAFRPVAQLAIDPAAGTARAALSLPAAAPADAPFLLHPVRLDGAMQGMIGLLEEGGIEPGCGFVPVRMTRLVVRRGAPVAAAADIRLIVRGERSACADLVLRDGAGNPVAVLEGCWVQKIRLPGRAEAGQDLFRIAWLPAPALAEASAPLADLPAATAALKAAAGRLPDLQEARLLLEAYAAASAAGTLAAGPVPGAYGSLLRELSDRALADVPREAIWRDVLLERPELAHELAWLAEAAAHPTRSDPALPAPDAAGLERMAEALAEAAAAIARTWPEGRPLRVLEIAAGAGPLTRLLAARLAPTGRRVILHAASLPGGPPVQVPGPGVEFDTSAWDPLSGDPPPITAELVVGLFVDLKLRQRMQGADASLPVVLRQAVAPGGALLLAEAMPGTLWDFTLGRDPRWWEGPGLPDAEGWLAALADAGWQDAAVHPLPGTVLPAAAILARAPQGAAVLPSPLSRRLVLVADAASLPLRAALAQLAQARGAEVTAITLEEASQLSARSLQGAVMVLLLAPEAEAEALGRTLAQLGRLAAAVQGVVAGMRLITRGGEAAPAAAALQGMARVLANEMPELRLRRCDLDPALTAPEAARRLLAELVQEQESEAEVALSAEARRVPRVLPGLPPPPPAPGHRRLAVAQPGKLDTLHWAPMAAPTPGPGEVLVRVEAAGLNFRDLMWAQGLLPEETLLPGFAGPGLGIELAGVVEAAGPDTSWRPGDPVFGFAPRAIAGLALTRADALTRRPEGLSPAAAATVPVAFLTAVYALEELAKLAPGEVVLIHGGAGAVGLAALQVALAAGARVIATAGSEAKRAFLREAGAELVLDSRDPGFADALRARGIPGVDVALNSLAGEAMERTLGLMRPFGRFIELGKRDFAENRRVPLRPLRRNVTYFAVDVDELPRARPQVAARLLAGIAERLQNGTFSPLPHALRRAEEVEAAFRALQASSHIGKLVIAPPPPAPAERRREWNPAGGVVVVVGGVQGFGLAAARWLRRQGVERFALLSRRGPATPGADAVLAELGPGARIFAVDATDREALAAILQTVRAEQGPITGVVHAAAVFQDGTAAGLTAEAARRVLTAKLTVADHLDRLTASDPLRLFLLFSSATVPVGSPGQAAYVAANAALEAIARRRAAAGLPACAVAWGPIADVGVLAKDEATAAGLSRRLGAVALPAMECLDRLPEILESGLPVVGLARIAWQEAAAALPVLKEPAFSVLRAGLDQGAEGEGADLRERCRGLPDQEALSLLREAVRAELGRILRLPPAAIAPDAPLPSLGLDSLGGMELRTALERRLGGSVALASVTEDLTVEALSRRLLAGLRGDAGEAAIEARIAVYEPSAEGSGSAAAAKDAAE